MMVNTKHVIIARMIINTWTTISYNPTLQRQSNSTVTFVIILQLDRVDLIVTFKETTNLKVTFKDNTKKNKCIILDPN